MKKILIELHDVPEQLSRKDNANVDLVLDNSVKTNSDKAYTSDQTYTETKYLLLSLMRELPSNEEISIASVDELVECVLEKSCNNSNRRVAELVNRFRTNCKVLEEVGLVNKGDDYSTLRHDAATVRFIET